jgi:hypothetical protein
VTQLGIFSWGRLKIFFYETRVAREEGLATMKIFSTPRYSVCQGKCKNMILHHYDAGSDVNGLQVTQLF